MAETTLLVGTKKGLFSIESRNARSGWNAPSAIMLDGWSINHAVKDPRTGRIWACAHSDIYGPKITFSDDDGRTWEDCDGPKNPDEPVERFWIIAPGPPDNPKTLFAGSARSQLWRTDDAGKSWQMNEALRDHPTRNDWEPGGGGMCLHTIVQDDQDSDKMWIAVSTGGVYYTEDGGASWEPRNKGTKADFFPGNTMPDWGQ